MARISRDEAQEQLALRQDKILSGIVNSDQCSDKRPDTRTVSTRTVSTRTVSKTSAPKKNRSIKNDIIEEIKNSFAGRERQRAIASLSVHDIHDHYSKKCVQHGIPAKYPSTLDLKMWKTLFDFEMFDSIDSVIRYLDCVMDNWEYLKEKNYKLNGQSPTIYLITKSDNVVTFFSLLASKMSISNSDSDLPELKIESF